MLKVNNLTRTGLQPASFTLGKGECAALTGPSGAGKSLLLRAIADLDPNEGDVSLAGTARSALPAPQWRQKVAYLPAESGWWAPRVRDHFKTPEAALGLVTALGLPADCLDWPVERLSTGEKQRLALARLLALGPNVCLLDEPTSALDPAAVAAAEALIRCALDDGAAILFTTHDAAQARRLARRTLHIENGRLTETAS